MGDSAYFSYTNTTSNPSECYRSRLSLSSSHACFIIATAPTMFDLAVSHYAVSSTSNDTYTMRPIYSLAISKCSVDRVNSFVQFPLVFHSRP